jgi:hypothetical protein
MNESAHRTRRRGREPQPAAAEAPSPVNDVSLRPVNVPAPPTFDRAANAATQCQEVEMLLLIDRDAFRDADALASLVLERQEELAAHFVPQSELAFCVNLATAAPAFEAGEIRPDAPCKMDVLVRLPFRYPSSGPPTMQFDTKHVPKEVIDALLQRVNEVNESMSTATNQGWLQDLFSALRERFAEAMQNLAEDKASDDAERQLAEAASQEVTVASLIEDERVLGRRCVYYHHIIGTAKRQCIAQWSKQLGINGWARIGYPGILILEGPECTVELMVRLLQRLRWKLMVVRGEERIELPSGAASLDAARVIPSHGVIEVLDTSDIADRCRAAGIEELFLTSMKKYR